MRKIKKEISHYIACKKNRKNFPWEFERWWTTFPLDHKRQLWAISRKYIEIQTGERGRMSMKDEKLGSSKSFQCRVPHNLSVF